MDFNTSLEKNIRRTEDERAVSGTAVLALVEWSSIKVCVEVFIRRRDIVEAAAGTGASAREVMMATILILAVGIFFTTIIHIYIGLSARMAAYGKRKAPPYTILSVLLLLMTVLSAFDRVLNAVEETEASSSPASLLIDITLIAALFGVIRATGKLKKLRLERGRIPECDDSARETVTERS